MKGGEDLNCNERKRTDSSAAEPAKENIMIPKERFDEINNKYKESKIYVLKLEEIIRTMDEKISGLEDSLMKVKSEYAEEKTFLDLKGIFVDGGFKKGEYEGIIERISCPTREEKLELAKEIVKLKRLK